MLLFTAEQIEALKEPARNNSTHELDLYYMNNKCYRVSDSPLTYRQINSISNDLLDNKQRKNRTWRKFSFKDLIFLELIRELRIYGFKNKQLKDLKDSFYRKKPDEEEMLQDENFMRNYKNISEFALIAVFNGGNVFIIIDEQYHANYLFSTDIPVNVERNKSMVLLSLSKIVSNVSERLGHGKVSYLYYGSRKLSKQERELLQIIEYDDYKQITLRKKDGKNKYILKEEKLSETTEEDLLKTIQEKKFADIKIVKRDGKIVHIKVEESRII